MDAFLLSVLGSLVRFGLVWLASRMVEWGVWAPGDTAGYIAAGTLALTACLWSAWKAYAHKIKFLTALMMPAGSTEQDVKDHIAARLPTPALTTPPDTAPGVPKP